MTVLVDPARLDAHHRGDEGCGQSGLKMAAFKHDGIHSMRWRVMGNVASLLTARSLGADLSGLEAARPMTSSAKANPGQPRRP
jgi:hypothetical protein